MSGLFSQVGVAKEVRASVATTAGVGSGAAIPSIATITTASAHSLRAGDVVTIAGCTPSGYNGVWAVSTVPSTTTFTIQTGTVTLAAITVQGTVVATAFGVSTTPTRFFEFVQESMKSMRKRIESKSIASGNRVMTATKFAVFEDSAAGDLTLEVTSKGFGYWLEGMLGTVASGTLTDSSYTHTATLGPLRGKSMTYQKLLPQAAVSGGVNTVATASAGTVLTYLGCKVDKWELSNAVDGILTFKVSLIGRNEVINVPLAAASYPTGSEMLSFIGGTVTIDGTAVASVKGITISCDNKLATRRYVGPASLNGEPLESDLREIKWSLDMEFVDTSMLTKYQATTAAGTLASIVCRWAAPTLIGSTTYPSLTVTMPNCRVDGETPTINGADLLQIKVEGPALNTSTTSADAITIAYVTTDSTP